MVSVLCIAQCVALSWAEVKKSLDGLVLPSLIWQGFAMPMNDFASPERFAEMEKELARRTGMAVFFTDSRGNRITPARVALHLAPVCALVRATADGVAAVCSPTSGFFSSQAAATGEPVVDECDAGLVKICVPILARGVHEGDLNACGLLAEDGEVETYLVSKAAGVPETEAEHAARNMQVADRKCVDAAANLLTSAVQDLIRDRWRAPSSPEA